MMRFVIECPGKEIFQTDENAESAEKIREMRQQREPEFSVTDNYLKSVSHYSRKEPDKKYRFEVKRLIRA